MRAIESPRCVWREAWSEMSDSDAPPSGELRLEGPVRPVHLLPGHETSTSPEFVLVFLPLNWESKKGQADWYRRWMRGHRLTVRCRRGFLDASKDALLPISHDSATDMVARLKMRDPDSRLQRLLAGSGAIWARLKRHHGDAWETSLLWTHDQRTDEKEFVALKRGKEEE